MFYVKLVARRRVVLYDDSIMHVLQRVNDTGLPGNDTFCSCSIYSIAQEVLNSKSHVGYAVSLFVLLALLCIAFLVIATYVFVMSRSSGRKFVHLHR